MWMGKAKLRLGEPHMSCRPVISRWYYTTPTGCIHKRPPFYRWC